MKQNASIGRGWRGTAMIKLPPGFRIVTEEEAESHAALVAENAQMREALRKLAVLPGHDPREAMQCVERIVTAALRRLGR